MGDLDPATVSTVMTGADVFFVLIGAILVFAMHGGFAFLEVGTVRRKNQVNALVKILVDFSISTIAYFFVGFAVAYGTTFIRRPWSVFDFVVVAIALAIGLEGRQWFTLGVALTGLRIDSTPAFTFQYSKRAEP